MSIISDAYKKSMEIFESFTTLAADSIDKVSKKDGALIVGAIELALKISSLLDDSIDRGYKPSSS